MLVSLGRSPVDQNATSHLFGARQPPLAMDWNSVGIGMRRRVSSLAPLKTPMFEYVHLTSSKSEAGRLM